MIRDSLINLAITVEMVQEIEHNREWLKLETQLGRALSRKLRINKSLPILKVLKTITSNLTGTVTADHRSPIKTLSNMQLIVTSMPILKA